MAPGSAPAQEEAKANIKAEFEKQNESFFRGLSCSGKIATPIVVKDIKITKPEFRQPAFHYYIDIEFETAKPTGFFEKKKNFKFESGNLYY